jgi:hypothetical protein
MDYKNAMHCYFAHCNMTKISTKIIGRIIAVDWNQACGSERLVCCPLACNLSVPDPLQSECESDFQTPFAIGKWAPPTASTDGVWDPDV